MRTIGDEVPRAKRVAGMATSARLVLESRTQIDAEESVTDEHSSIVCPDFGPFFSNDLRKPGDGFLPARRFCAHIDPASLYIYVSCAFLSAGKERQLDIFPSRPREMWTKV